MLKLDTQQAGRAFSVVKVRRREKQSLTWIHVFSFMLFAFGGDACACVRVLFKVLPRGLAIQNYNN